MQNPPGSGHDSETQPPAEPASALVVDDEPSVREFMRFALSKQCCQVEVAQNVEQADQLMQRFSFDVLIVDVRLQGMSGVDWITARRINGDRIPVVFMSADMEALSALDVSGAAGDEFVEKPFSLVQMLAAVERILARRSPTRPAEQRLSADRQQARKEPAGKENRTLPGMVSQSTAMGGVLSLLRRVASRSTTVLLEGESGTGKELAARCLHLFSDRTGPFVPVNCGAISSDLLESELFGHTRGSFTGATQQREGLFSYANGGTILLDEICEMPYPMQAKLLRVLEERVIRPVGAEREQPIDVRIIAATNRNLSDEVNLGNFREDLYYRLNVLALRMPPLRERPEDIAPLITQFSESLSVTLDLPPLTLGDKDITRLQQHNWPGNVRELRNLVERAMLLVCSPADCIDSQDVMLPQTAQEPATEGYPLNMPLDEVEKRHMIKVLADCGGNQSEAARRLKISRKTLERKVRLWRSAD